MTTKNLTHPEDIEATSDEANGPRPIESGYVHPKRKARKVGRNTSIYLIVNEARTSAKVGVAVDVKKRLAMLQTGNPDRLEVIATAPGGLEEEAAIHRNLKDLGVHVSGEWFREPGTCLHALARYGMTITVGQLPLNKSMRPNLLNLNRAVREDSDLLLLLSWALDVEQGTRCSCSQFNRELKPEIRRSVGYSSYAKNEWLKGHEAYTAILRGAWASLPPCRKELCAGSDDWCAQ